MSASLSVLSVLDRMCGCLIRIQAQDRFFFFFKLQLRDYDGFDIK